MFTGLGAALFGLSLFVGLALLVGWLMGAIVVRGWAVVSWTIGMATSLNLLFLGVLGEYLGKLFMAYSGLPPYVEKKKGKE